MTVRYNFYKSIKNSCFRLNLTTHTATETKHTPRSLLHFLPSCLQSFILQDILTLIVLSGSDLNETASYLSGRNSHGSHFYRNVICRELRATACGTFHLYLSLQTLDLSPPLITLSPLDGIL